MNKTVCAILLAAGSSTRMGRDKEGEAINKMLLKIAGATPIERCARAFCRHVDELVIVVSESTEETALSVASKIDKPVKVVMGGARRQDSVLNGIRATECDIVAIHDSARCLITDAVIEDAIRSAAQKNSGVAAISVRDTLRVRATGETVDRSLLVQMQTPQCFDREMLLKAYEGADGTYTDDASIFRSRYGSVELTMGSMLNQKLTEKDDIEFFENALNGGKPMRIGIGEDTHRLVEERRLIIGGVEIPFRLGLLGHSDADVLIHAVIDAMLGAGALGDIGKLFPDKDPAYKDISSVLLLERTAALLKENGYYVSNIDATVTAQEPKLAAFIPEMRKIIADAAGRIGIENVSVKATTPEHLGPEGNLEGITARAVVMIGRIVF